MTHTVQSLMVHTAGSNSRGNSESEISYTHGSDSHLLLSDGYSQWNEQIINERSKLFVIETVYYMYNFSPFIVASIGLDIFSYPSDQGTFKLTNHGGVIYASWSTESSLRQFFSRDHLACIHHIYHVTPHIVILLVQVRWPQWPILRTATTDPSVRELIQMLLLDPNEMSVCSVMLVVHLTFVEQRWEAWQFVLQKAGINIACQTLRQYERSSEVITHDIALHVYGEAMLVGTFYSSM
jgi:hypothetical protein